MRKKFFILSLFLYGITIGCKKESPSATNTGVPNVAVNFSIDLSNPQYTNLEIVGGWMNVTGGYDGIVIYHQTTDNFLAFDRGCTYDCASNTKAILNVQVTGFSAVCPVCGSKFSIVSGNALSGPATLPLKQYQASFDGANTLTVSN